MLAPWYSGLADLTDVLWWALRWLGWLLLLGMVCAGACWCCRRTGVDFWLQAGPPARPGRRQRQLRAEASRGIEQIEDFLEEATPR